MTEDIIEVHDATTAAEFLAALLPDSPTMHGQAEPAECRDQLIYRGLGDAKFRLIPSALRPGSQDRLYWCANVETNEGDTELRPFHRYAELSVAKQFFRLADAQGLHLPESNALRRAFSSPVQMSLYVESALTPTALWPPDDLLTLLGLAQHYGLPTTLLDWTRDPNVAAYFAVIDAIRLRDRPNPPEHMAVWALDTLTLEVACRHSEQKPPIPVEVVTAPAALIPNLRAQKGLFTVHRSPTTNEQVDRRPLDDQLGEAVDPSRRPFFRQVRLPASEARVLHDLLALRGMNAALIYPGYFGVAQALERGETM